MIGKQSLKYGVAALAIAIAIILAAVAINPPPVPINHGTSQTSQSTTSQSTTQSQQGTGAVGNFVLMLTDPPEVPTGTTQLNLTYSGLSLQVNYPNVTSRSLPVKASGTINLLALVNVTQTIASTTIPPNSTISKIQLTISSVSAKINGQVFPVTTLSNQLVVSIGNANQKTQALSGALLNINPTLVQIQATNSTGGRVSYYVLVPSATAIVKPTVTGDQSKVGTKHQLEKADRDNLEHAQGAKDVTVTSAAISASGTTTKFTITLKNQGNTNATISGLTVHGQFNATRVCSSTTSSSSTSGTTSTTTTTSHSSSSTTTTTTTSERDHERSSTATTTTSRAENEGHGPCSSNAKTEHPDTIPFRINGTSLVPILGDGGDEGHRDTSSITLRTGQSITLSFSGSIQLNAEGRGHGPSIVIMPVSGTTYTIRLMGEGFQTIQVKAS